MFIRTLISVALVLLAAGALSLPATLLEDAQQAEQRAAARAGNKVKRAQEVILFGNQQNRAVDPNDYYTGGKKRAVAGGAEAGASPAMYRAPGGKTVAQYEKGYRYGTGKAALDKHVENALLKTELYGDPSAVNQYRYYGGATESHPDDRSFSPPSKRSSYRPLVPRALPVSQAAPRLKRDLEMDPEEMLALLSLWQQNANSPYRPQQNRWTGYGAEPEEFDMDVDNEDLDNEEQTGEWLDGPVYPSGRTHYTVDRRSYYYPAGGSQYQYQYPAAQKRETAWGGFAKDKRFMVSRKRQAGGAQQQPGSIHYLAQLLAPTHHDPRVPVYHRVVL